MPGNIDTILKEFGLSALASRCYWHLRANDHMPASRLAQGLGIGRTHVYRALRELEKREFTYSFKVGHGVTYYSAYSPREALERYLLYLRRLALPFIESDR